MRDIKAMAGRVAKKMVGETESNESLRNVDEAVDNIIASLISIEENLPGITADSVRQKAALDIVKETMDEAVKPYFADIVNALQAFDE